MLSFRLRQIADRIKYCELLADIGTDHAYIPIYAVKNGIAKRAVAADISEGSCSKARLNVNTYGLSECIEVRQGSGLEVINEDESPDAIVIAGMGGLLMISILEAGREVLSRTEQLILQPQRDIEEARRHIHSIGFKIAYESLFKDGGKFYTLLDCERGNENYTDMEYMFGKIPLENSSPVLREYVNIKYNKLLKVLKNLEAGGKKSDEAYKKIYAEAEMCREAEKCL